MICSVPLNVVEHLYEEVINSIITWQQNNFVNQVMPSKDFGCCWLAVQIADKENHHHLWWHRFREVFRGINWKYQGIISVIMHLRWIIANSSVFSRKKFESFSLVDIYGSSFSYFNCSCCCLSDILPITWGRGFLGPWTIFSRAAGNSRMEMHLSHLLNTEIFQHHLECVTCNGHCKQHHILDQFRGYYDIYLVQIWWLYLKSVMSYRPKRQIVV